MAGGGPGENGPPASPVLGTGCDGGAQGSNMDVDSEFHLWDRGWDVLSEALNDGSQFPSAASRSETIELLVRATVA